MKNINMEKARLLQGNEACVQGALYAGIQFFAGYPITPSTEIAEGLARELPRIGAKFIQMEDEIGSLAAVIGASNAGCKAMTATSGPGYSLMQEHIGYAYITETPCVIIDVQRGGPSTGLPTKVSQSDTMQARWGTHGDYTAIAVAPSSVREVFEETVRAFNLAERFRTPVTVLTDEVLGHMREMMVIPEKGELEIVNRKKPDVPTDWYKHFDLTADFVSPMAAFGEGYRYNVSGLTHDQEGFPTAVPSEIKEKLDKLRNKIERFSDEIFKMRTEMMDDARIAVISYGSVARASYQAVKIAREKRIKVGAIQPLTIWPFPDAQLRQMLSGVKKVIVAELNMGQMVHEVRRVAPKGTEVFFMGRYDGEVMTPQQIVSKIGEVK
ncbi:MAG: 2-oxoacid:acceptor oxidoreductase subunit alpha [candidate division Zixibacteria bacterium]|jgi:2-oxoglutarate ferredoxin oxidoreductase subunit alpha|nr:2-oxoacid:acceptor oxidoreductase subunit alpha [candidate division Zixibacteria bacterium]